MRRVSSTFRTGVVPFGLASLWLVGCVSEPATSRGEIERLDSAGIEVLKLPAWTLDSMPHLTVLGDGVILRGDEVDSMPLSRIEGGILLKSGRVVIGEGIQNKVIILDRTGDPLRSFGTLGEGPEEFSGVDGLRSTPEGHVAVWDNNRGQLIVFDTLGSFVERVPTPAARTAQRMLPFPGFLRDGSLAFERRDLAPPTEMGRHQTTFTVDRFAPDGEFVGSMIAIRGPDRMGTESRQGNRSWSSVLFSGDAFVAVADGRAFVGTGRRFVIWQITSDGIVRVVQVDQPRRVASEVRKSAELEEAQRRWARFSLPGVGRGGTGEFEVADSLPFFDRLEGDGQGRLWVRLVPNDDEACCSWVVFDSTGVPTMRARIPEDFNFLDARGRGVLGFVEDEFDVPSILLHQLVER